MLWIDMYSTSNNFYNNNNNNNNNVFSTRSFQIDPRQQQQQDIYNTPTQFKKSGSVGSMSSTTDEENTSYHRRNLKRKASLESEKSREEKRKNFLERNRQGSILTN